MTWRGTYEGGEPQRVNRWLAQSGVCSRREAEALIASGVVTIDGALVSDPGHKISPGQTLTIAESGRAALEAQTTYILNKPVGFVSAQPEPGQTPAARLLTRANLVGEGKPPSPRAALAPLGRLDRDSRGLLLLSQDGALAKAVIGPNSKLEKEYVVTVRGKLTHERLSLLRHGLALDGRRLLPAEVDELQPLVLRFVLREGRNRQIRRMCSAVGLAVNDLQRVRIGPLRLGDLPEGRWRPLDRDEREALMQRG